MTQEHAVSSDVLIGNVLQFMRLLRKCGFSLGLEADMLALQVTGEVGFGNFSRLARALASLCVKSKEERTLFFQAFEIFWRGERLGAPQLMAETGVSLRQKGEKRDQRLLEALFSHAETDVQEETHLVPQGWSHTERLMQKDFAQMSLAEFHEARDLLRLLYNDLPKRHTRRWRQAGDGLLDWRDQMQQIAYRPWGVSSPRHIVSRDVPWPMVLLLDISGSMECYSRMFLHYAHVLRQRKDVASEVFVFSTRLFRVTSWMSETSADQALARVGRSVDVWDGGTSIGSCLKEFLRSWGKRLLDRPLIVLVSDGLDRGDTSQLQEALIEMKRGCHLVWLNPLLRYEGYRALAQGASHLEHYADSIGRMHNLKSLAGLGNVFQEALAA